MGLIVPNSNRSHAWMLGLAVASFIAWLLSPDESYKMCMVLFTGLLVVIVWITCLAHVFNKPNKRLILLAAAASLGSCTGQMRLIGKDLDQIVADMAHFNCIEARRIVRTGHGFGRTWKPTDRTGEWQADLPDSTRFHNLYLYRRTETDQFLLGVPMPDMPTALASCKPDPAAPAEVWTVH